MKPARIVLIEDNPADVFLVELALKENGVAQELTKFKSGEEGMKVLCSPTQENEFVPDAILLDLNTPQSDGFEVLAKLKQCPRLAGVPIAVITSSYAIARQAPYRSPRQPVHSEAYAVKGVSRHCGAKRQRNVGGRGEDSTNMSFLEAVGGQTAPASCSACHPLTDSQ